MLHEMRRRKQNESNRPVERRVDDAGFDQPANRKFFRAIRIADGDAVGREANEVRVIARQKLATRSTGPAGRADLAQFLLHEGLRRRPLARAVRAVQNHQRRGRQADVLLQHPPGDILPHQLTQMIHRTNIVPRDKPRSNE